MLSAALLEAFDQELLKAVLCRPEANRCAAVSTMNNSAVSTASTTVSASHSLVDGGGGGRASRGQPRTTKSTQQPRRDHAGVLSVDSAKATLASTSTVAGVVVAARQVEQRSVRFSSDVEACPARAAGSRSSSPGPMPYEPGASPTKSAMKRASYAASANLTIEDGRSRLTPTRGEAVSATLAGAPVRTQPPSAFGGASRLESGAAKPRADSATTESAAEVQVQSSERPACLPSHGRTESISPWKRLMSRSRRDEMIQRMREEEEQKLRESCTFRPKLSSRTSKQLAKERREAQSALSSASTVAGGDGGGAVGAADLRARGPMQPPLTLRPVGGSLAQATDGVPTNVDEQFSDESNPTSGLVTPIGPVVPTFPAATSLLSSRPSAPHLPLFVQREGEGKKNAKSGDVDERHPRALRRDPSLRSPSFVRRLSSSQLMLSRPARLSPETLRRRSMDLSGEGNVLPEGAEEGVTPLPTLRSATRQARPYASPRVQHGKEGDRTVSPSLLRAQHGKDSSTPRRSIEDLFKWEESRQESLRALRQEIAHQQVAAQAAKEAEWRRAVPLHQSPGNQRVLRGLGDRRITAVEHASMVAAARREQLLQQQQRNLYSGSPMPASRGERNHSAAEAPQPTGVVHQDPHNNVLQWWVTLAHSDPAYVRNLSVVGLTNPLPHRGANVSLRTTVS